MLTNRKTLTKEQRGGIRDRIRAARLAHGWSQEHLSRLAGLSRSYICLIEQPQRHTEPSLAVLVELARVLGVTLDHLVTGSPIAGVFETTDPGDGKAGAA